MSPDDTSALPRVLANQLQPYISVLLLRTLEDPQLAFERLARAVRSVQVRDRQKKATRLLADGLSLDGSLQELTDGASLDAFVWSIQARPGWATEDSSYIDTTHELYLAMMSRGLIAVHCSASVCDNILVWLEKDPRPPLQKIPEGVLHATLLSGDAKNLWLRGTHARRNTKPDSKVIGGQNLQQALGPLQDSTFAMGSARAEMIDDPDFASLTGIVGTTPRKSKVWLKASKSMPDFIRTCQDLLRSIGGAMGSGQSLSRPFPWLATEEFDYTAVHSAYEVSVLDSEALPSADRSTEVEASAELLASATIIVQGSHAGPDFDLDVGLGGSIGGKLTCAVVDRGGSADLSFGYKGEPTDSAQVKPVLDALSQTSLLTVHYESGHSITNGHLWRTRIGEAAFPGWKWLDFAGYSICDEKPPGNYPQEIHDQIGRGSDRSLFSWVLKEYGPKGFLTCDDGPNEVADFVVLCDTEELILIHVKSSSTDAPLRRLNVNRYEIVVSQAEKNLRYLESDLLAAHLTKSTYNPATWYQGERVADRSEMTEYLRQRAHSRASRVVIVQPQNTKTARNRAWGTAGGPEHARVRLLETLLNGTRAAATAVGSELEVVGSLLP